MAGLYIFLVFVYFIYVLIKKYDNKCYFETPTDMKTNALLNIKIKKIVLKCMFKTKNDIKMINDVDKFTKTQIRICYFVFFGRSK